MRRKTSVQSFNTYTYLLGLSVLELNKRLLFMIIDQSFVVETNISTTWVTFRWEAEIKLEMCIPVTTRSGKFLSSWDVGHNLSVKSLYDLPLRKQPIKQIPTLLCCTYKLVMRIETNIGKM